MPASPRSLQLTDSYRDRLAAIRFRVEARARAAWPTIDQLDNTRWAPRMATVLSQAQAEAVRLTSGYLSAYLSSELGTRTRGPAIPSADFAGQSRSGLPLTDSMETPIIVTLSALKEGEDPQAALDKGWQKARFLLELGLMTAARGSLQEGLAADGRFSGWRRAVRGTCGACMAASATGGTPGEPMDIHPGCQCVAEPTVSSVPNRYPRPAGTQIFNALSAPAQDAALGAAAAAAVREGEVELADLVRHERFDGDAESFITQRPLEDAQ